MPQCTSCICSIQSVPFQRAQWERRATVDLVLVLDTSESMASDTDCGLDGSCTPDYVVWIILIPPHATHR